MLSRLKERFIALRAPLSALLAVASVFLVMFLLGLPCPILYITGISCAGCGITRAWRSALRLDFISAMTYHPLFWAVPIAFLAFLLIRRYPRISKITLTVLISLDLLLYLIRLFDPSCTVVIFEPSNGLIYRIIHSLLTQAGIL